MNKEDYFKYYIQGSDHYLIPKDVFIELFNEMMNWREESEELKKQLEEYKDKINWYENFEINKTIDKLRIKHNNQQKEFIKYLKDMLDNENDIFSVVRVKDVLNKYKETIGVKDE